MSDEQGAYYYYYTPGGPDKPRRNPLKAIVAPRPIAWVSTVSRDGVGNLAPYSFFNMINDTPPMVAISSVGFKDTVRNIRDSGEFAVNIATRDLAEQMNVTSQDLPPDIDEFDAAGLVRRTCREIGAAAVDGSPAILECRAVEVKQLADMEGTPVDTWLVIGQVIGVHLRADCMVEGQFRTELGRPILRAGYADEYWEIDGHHKFSMRR